MNKKYIDLLYEKKKMRVLYSFSIFVVVLHDAPLQRFLQQ